MNRCTMVATSLLCVFVHCHPSLPYQQLFSVLHRRSQLRHQPIQLAPSHHSITIKKLHLVVAGLAISICAGLFGSMVSNQPPHYPLIIAPIPAPAVPLPLPLPLRPPVMIRARHHSHRRSDVSMHELQELICDTCDILSNGNHQRHTQ